MVAAVKLQPRYSRIALKKLGVQITTHDRLDEDQG
jgi:hypothetical protein